MSVDRLRSMAAKATRPTLVPMLVRNAIFVSTLTAFVLAYPVEFLTGRTLGPLVIVAALPAIWPRRVWPTVAVLAAVAGWLLATGGYHEPMSLWRMLGLAGSLYLSHSLCALAAALPYDAVVAPDVVARWVFRALGVVLASAVGAILLLRLVGPGGDTFLLAALAGLAAAVGAAALLARLVRRP